MGTHPPPGDALRGEETTALRTLAATAASDWRSGGQHGSWPRVVISGEYGGNLQVIPAATQTDDRATREPTEEDGPSARGTLATTACGSRCCDYDQAPGISLVHPVASPVSPVSEGAQCHAH